MPEIYRPKVVVKDKINPYAVDGRNTPPEWDGINKYGNVSPEVFGKAADPECIVKIMRDCDRKKLVFLLEDFRSEELFAMMKPSDCYTMNLSVDQYHTMDEDVTEKHWSLAIQRTYKGAWRSCLAYGDRKTGQFPDPYPYDVKPDYAASVSTSVEYEKNKHVILELELDLVDEPPVLPLEDKTKIPPICLNDEVGIEIRVFLKTPEKGRYPAGEGQYGPYLTIPMLNEIPEKDKPWKRYWPVFNYHPIEWADMFAEKPCAAITTTTSTCTTSTETKTKTIERTVTTERTVTEQKETQGNPWCNWYLAPISVVAALSLYGLKKIYERRNEYFKKRAENQKPQQSR